MTAANRALAFLQHLKIDPESDAILEALTTALASGLERAALVAHGDTTTPPAAAIRDPRYAPLWGLPAAANWTGGTMPARQAGESDDDYLERARIAVVRPRGMRRGSSRSLADTAREHLTGPWDDRWVQVTERYDGDEWATLVTTRTDQTPDVAALLAACNAPDVLVAGEEVVHAFDDSPLIGQMSAVIDDIAVEIDDMTLADVT